MFKKKKNIWIASTYAFRNYKIHEEFEMIKNVISLIFVKLRNKF